VVVDLGRMDNLNYGSLAREHPCHASNQG